MLHIKTCDSYNYISSCYKIITIYAFTSMYILKLPNFHMLFILCFKCKLSKFPILLTNNIMILWVLYLDRGNERKELKWNKDSLCRMWLLKVHIIKSGWVFITEWTVAVKQLLFCNSNHIIFVFLLYWNNDQIIEIPNCGIFVVNCDNI